MNHLYGSYINVFPFVVISLSRVMRLQNMIYTISNSPRGQITVCRAPA